MRVPLAVEQLLPLPDHAQVAVVQDADLDGQLVLDGRGQLLHRHDEAAVAVDVDDRGVGQRDLRADGRRQAEAHRAQPAGGDELPRPAER